MKRAVLGLGLTALFAAAPVAAGTAAAAPPVKVTIVLACDKGVSAQADISLLDHVGGSTLTNVTASDLSCGDFSPTGRARARVVVSDVPAGAVLVNQYHAIANSVDLPCTDGTGGGSLPFESVCAPYGAMTATLSVK
jgi:hypothetical protein